MRFGAVHNFAWLLTLPVLIIFWVVAFRMRRQALAAFGKLDLVQKLARSVSWRRRIVKLVLFAVGIFFLVLSMTRPKFGTRIETAFRRGVDVVVAIDVSRSMLARDIAPNRLAKAKAEVASLVNRFRGDRIGIVAFAGVAYLQCPLTLDYGAAKLFLEMVEVGLIPKPGTNLGEAIRTSVAAFDKRQRKHKVLILLTDGEDHGKEVKKAAEEAKKAGVRIFTIGIGKPSGDLIPSLGGGFKKNKSGQVIRTRLDVATLQRIAVLTGGKFHHATKSEIELDKVYKEIRAMEKKELFSRKAAHYEERFQIPLAFALLFLIIESLLGERRRREEEWGGRFA